jgi:D-alanyl-D-alanine dipeptidase/pimeloyl-ACP methyl ester carboxylesterase
MMLPKSRRGRGRSSHLESQPEFVLAGCSLPQYNAAMKLGRIFLSLLFVLASAAGAFCQTPFVPPEVDTRSLEPPGEDPVWYSILLPEKYDPSKPVPLVLALHFGGNPEGAGRAVLEMLVAPALSDLGAIVVAPDSKGGAWMSPANERAVNLLLNDTLKNFNIDAKKIVVTGFSLGGVGAWQYGLKYPERFAAVIPIAGAPPASSAPWRLPVLAIHSLADRVMPIGPTQAYIARLRNAGVRAGMIELTGIAHHQTYRFGEGLKQAVPWLKALFAGAGQAAATAATQLQPWPREADNPDAPKPNAPPQSWLGLIGEYGPESEPLYILERGGRLAALFGTNEAEALDAVSGNTFQFMAGGRHDRQRVVFSVDARGRAVSVAVADVVYERRQVGPAEGSGQLRVQPLRPVPELLKEALAAQPPTETGNFRAAELVELVKLDNTVKLDIRYAGTNNFLGSVFYAEPRAFLQKPAAEALVRAHRKLAQLGYGLLIHDGYRPWYVTKTFWDATPADKKWLVANPGQGSRHNRGSAVDLTLYDLRTGLVIEMPSTYDESTPRAYAFYPGGTDLQRWHRALLRRVMEQEGFSVNQQEWWHFDHQDWRNYGIGNARFSDIK